MSSAAHIAHTPCALPAVLPTLFLSLLLTLCLVRTACCAVCRLAVPVARCQQLLHPSIFHLWPRSTSSSVDHFSWSFEVFILIYLHKIFMHSACCSDWVCVALCVCSCVCVCEESHLMQSVLSTQLSVSALCAPSTCRCNAGQLGLLSQLHFCSSLLLSICLSVTLSHSLWLVHSTALAAFQL